MRRRQFLAAAVAGIAAGGAGCLDALRSDRDGDGTPDSRDAAPSDPRVAERVGGDPPVSVDLEVIKRDADTATIRARHEGGDTFTSENTGRLELASGGTAVETVDLPFRVGDEHRIEGVPVGARAVLIWFDSAGDSARVVAAVEVEA